MPSFAVDLRNCIPSQENFMTSPTSSFNSLNSSGSSTEEVGKRGVATSTPVNKTDKIQVASFRDSAILGSAGSSQSSFELEQAPVQQRLGTDWYGLPSPMYGTLVPNRLFVGGISPQTSEKELCEAFTSYGNVVSAKIIQDRGGVSKGYGFITFETEAEARTICDGIANKELLPIVLRDRRLNIAPAVKKQQTRCDIVYPCATPSPPPFTGASFYISQGNASQYYYQAVPIPIGDNFYQQDLIPYGSHPYFPYYAPAPVPVPINAMYCLPEQYQQVGYSTHSVI